jgi:chromosome segregation protein
MLKLKKIQILGFKSFCDRTEVALPGNGIAVVVGPNGCGKSNILDGVTWVLGEQSAKTLRGGKMEDVIFAGTRSRKPLGMAEVSITLIDPEAYQGPLLDEPEISIENELPKDWDEDALRAESAAEVEEIISDSQPGQVIESAAPAGAAQEATANAAPEEAQATDGAPEAAASQEGGASSAVVLKIRRRKFQRVPQQGEIVVTRRLFRTGESEYLLNGKLCRLRDIQDIFMGTGLGPESYAIIGQERIGQLLSSKPHDRRAIIEEAAGITRFKTKKRLAELRLEQAKQNLARVNDIFEEVTRQMASLKRQAAKAERYGALRDELRGRLRVVLASKLAQMDAEQAGLQQEIQDTTASIDERSAKVEELDQQHAAGLSQGYALDEQAKAAQQQASQSAVELERTTTREQANRERLQELERRGEQAKAEQQQVRQQLEATAAEREAQRGFLQNAEEEAASFRAQAQASQQKMRDASQAVSAAEQKIEAGRRQAGQLLNQLNVVRNQSAQAEESLAALDREAARLEAEMATAKRDLENLGAERGQLSMRFESITETLQRLEQEIGAARAEIAQKRTEEMEARRKGDQLRSERASLVGRRDSIESLIRDHSYSTETVRKLFRANTLGEGLKPVGTLADFLEVQDQYENVVDEFLRDELNYVVVKSWDAANEGMRVLKTDVDGRATFLVHPEDSQALFSFAATENAQATVAERAGVVPLKDCIRVLNGFGRSLEVILPKLRDGYVTPDTETARSLALEHPRAFFLAPSGECFHNVTVTGGRSRSGGPLALKRDLREVSEKLAVVEKDLGQAEVTAAELSKLLGDLTRSLEVKSEERRQAERESAQQGAALRQMDSEIQRLDRRVQDWNLQSSRNKDARTAKQSFLEEKREEMGRLEEQHRAAESSIAEGQAAVAELRATREAAQQDAARLSAELAGHEERRRGAEAAFGRIDRLHGDLERRLQQIEQQMAAAAAEQQQRQQENEQLAVRREELSNTRIEAMNRVAELTQQATSLRSELAQVEQLLKTLRAENNALREKLTAATAREARCSADKQHLEETCLQDLGMEAAALRAEEGIAPLEGEALQAEDEACRGLKQKLESMGPVNMMALEEYRETEQRHAFLETQRKDLVDSIENTRATIKEIDEISFTKFNEAFARINENFSATFTRLFGGGQAFMRLTDEENTLDSGVDIVAQPPGKKLQNVFLLSGGEKALTVLALLMGIFQYQPSPFCVLDEVDAPLDETNVGRLADLLRSMSVDTQFVMVTHSKRMMTAADMIYGVTMQEQGVSKVVSVRMGGQERPAMARRATA